MACVGGARKLGRHLRRGVAVLHRLHLHQFRPSSRLAVPLQARVGRLVDQNVRVGTVGQRAGRVARVAQNSHAAGCGRFHEVLGMEHLARRERDRCAGLELAQQLQREVVGLQDRVDAVGVQGAWPRDLVQHVSNGGHSVIHLNRLDLQATARVRWRRAHALWLRDMPRTIRRWINDFARNFRLEGPYAGDVRHVARLVKGLEAAELVNLEPDPA
mmetsp:Transcript_15543/g.50755  ORF Transcript_15543/g.50755 Transcript_15543/m.50755 type:complete len:215 (-) Transcript_15543:590-1234(-)